MKRNTCRGFTLVELTIVIVIGGIIAAMLAVFLKPAIDSYFDSRRRAGLTDMADTALRRMTREIRLAVPNSIRTPNTQCFEFLPTNAGGRYRMAIDTDNTGSQALDITKPATIFDVFSPQPASSPAVGDWIVIGNQNTDDVYAGNNVSQITKIDQPANSALGTYRLTFNSKQFPAGYDGGRFVVVPNNGGKPAVTYACSGADGTVDSQGNAKGTLFRGTRNFDSTYPADCTKLTGTAILATHVLSCEFSYEPNLGATQQSGYIWMYIQLTEGNETIGLSSGAHVINVP